MSTLNPQEAMINQAVYLGSKNCNSGCTDLIRNLKSISIGSDSQGVFKDKRKCLRKLFTKTNFTGVGAECLPWLHKIWLLRWSVGRSLLLEQVAGILAELLEYLQLGPVQKFAVPSSEDMHQAHLDVLPAPLKAP